MARNWTKLLVPGARHLTLAALVCGFAACGGEPLDGELEAYEQAAREQAASRGGSSSADSPTDIAPPELRPIVFTPIPGGTMPPQTIAGKDGKLKEVDVAYVGGTPAVTITVAGTGSVGKLTSWSTSLGAMAQVLNHGPAMLGYEHQLHVLTPATSPKLDRELLVSGRIHDGTLWLTTWRVHADGTLEQLHSAGFGAQIGLTVEGYTLEHRELGAGRDGGRVFQLVTPLLDDGQHLRIVSWEIDGSSGQITGKYDSGDSGVVGNSASDLGAVFSPGDGVAKPHYRVSLPRSGGTMVQLACEVSDAGLPTLLQTSTSGRDLRRNNPVSQSAQDLVLAPLNDGGYVSAVNDGGGELKLIVWEGADCGTGNCVYAPSYITDDSLDLQPLTPGVQIQQPSNNIGTLRYLLRDPKHDSDLMSQGPDGVQAIASMRKVMVLVVALDAVAAGEVSLDDVVTVSTAAANVNNSGASKMGLVAGEQITLRELLYGNIMVSAGDATWAISEYVAGSLDDMVVRMNNKASELGMTNTFHCQRGTVFSSVSYSTARDQVRLWESVYQDPAFLEFIGKPQAVVCGTKPDDTELCHPFGQSPMTFDMDNYPNLDGYKPGGGGGLCSDIPQYQNTLSCAGSGCLGVLATRISRPLLAAELQPSSLTGSDWADARRLFDYGYRKIFTPDSRGSASMPALTDFALDTISDSHAVTARIVGKMVSLCNVAVDAEASEIATQNCSSHAYSGLASSSRDVPRTRLDIARLSTLLADGDYLLGRLEGNDLALSTWRVGQHGQ